MKYQLWKGKRGITNQGILAGIERTALHEGITLEWTTELPTASGLYRAKRKDGGFINWVAVGEFTYGHPFVLEFGSDVAYGIEDYSHWLGPLPVPELPEKPG